MKNKFLYIFLLVLLCVPVILPQVHAEQAPDITIKADNQSFRLKDLRGEVIYLDFWASWCVPCRESFPWMNEMEKKYAKKGFKVIAINLDEKKSSVDAFLARYPADFKIVRDPAGKSAEIFKLKGMPSSYLIDRQGNIVLSHIGFRQKDVGKLESAIKSALIK